MKDFILSEIKRLAKESGGVAPGQNAFTTATGVTPAKWRGVLWLRWSDALAEAGFAANECNRKLDPTGILASLARLTRRLERLPTRSEIKMERRLDTSFPNHSTIGTHFPTNAALSSALLKLAADDDGWSDLAAFLAPVASPDILAEKATAPEGFVYLLKSGHHYKIGRSEDIERRFREVKVALPEAVTLIHAIRTDDPSGIEAYWHRRFAEKRANGEWFALSGADVKAFRRRTFQ